MSLNVSLSIWRVPSGRGLHLRAFAHPVQCNETMAWLYVIRHLTSALGILVGLGVKAMIQVVSSRLVQAKSRFPVTYPNSSKFTASRSSRRSAFTQSRFDTVILLSNHQARFYHIQLLLTARLRNRSFQGNRRQDVRFATDNQSLAEYCK